ncbi:MAG: class I SAM-dependent methyltransferase [Hyphomicrobiaceae bacterium]
MAHYYDHNAIRHADIFDQIYRSKYWTHGSGPGSIAAFNKPLIAYLDRFLAANRVKRLVDFGCGDFQYMRHVNLAATEYIGLDVVPRILEENRKNFGREGITFEETPDDLTELPGGDLLLLKDVLIHLPNSYIAPLLQHARRTYRFVLAINNESDDASAYNRDIAVGEFRPVDISLAPFSLPSATIFHYGAARMLDPTLPRVLAMATRKFVWPGKKHVQLCITGI